MYHCCVEINGNLMSTPMHDDKDSHETLRVLVIEDSAGIAATIQVSLRLAGMEVEIAPTGEAAIALFDSLNPDIVLVDLGLPDMDGLELVARFANIGGSGIIVITANDAETTRVQGLETGADDYVVKPLAMRELVARVRAVRRRVGQTEQAQDAAPVAEGLVIDHARRLLRGESEAPTLLTEAEYLALVHLLEAAGASVSRDELSVVALRRNLHSDDRSVDQLVLKLRRKLTEQGASPRSILSVRGQGYLIADASVFQAAEI